MGAAVTPLFYDSAEPEYGQILAREYDLLVAENVMKWGALHPEPDVYNWNAAEAILSFAQKNNQVVRGHTLVWHEQLPRWVYGIETAEAMTAALRDHVQTVARHFAGRIVGWDVVNEAINEDGSLRSTPFTKLLGREYIAQVFRWAHEADPNAKLYYNDFNTEGINAKSDAVYELVKSLLADGVPIDGVGFQTHVSADFDVNAVRMRENLERFRALGVDVQLTEVDVQTRGSAPEKWQSQARVYGDLMRTCLAVKCSAFITWGFTDAYSWRAGSSPLPFDSNYRPKLAFQALLEALRP
jgi:endo-1,4-beta-xylanase